MVRRGNPSYARADDGDVRIRSEGPLAALLRERVSARSVDPEGVGRVGHGQGRACAVWGEQEHLLVLREGVEEHGEDGHGGQQLGEGGELHVGSVGR